MYNRHSHSRVTAVGDALTKLVLNELREQHLKGFTVEQLMERFGLSKYQSEEILAPRTILFRDVLDLCQLLNLDIGISVRTLEGRETTFYPGVNFTEGSTSDKPLVASEAASPTTTVVPAGWKGDEYGGMD